MAAIQQKAPDAEYFAIKLFGGTLRASSGRLIKAIEWTLENGMDIVNLSLGTPNFDYRAELQSLVTRAEAAGVGSVSARNDGNHPVLPGMDGVIGVDVDDTLPRHRYRVDSSGGSPCLWASGFPRPLPGMPPERNLHGISFAVANVTGFVARACEGIERRTYGAILRTLTAEAVRANDFSCARSVNCSSACLAVSGGSSFVISTEDVTSEFPGAPRVQSFSFAQWKGRWVIIGGRTAGYHGVGGGSAEFLRADANGEVWVLDTTVKPVRTYHAPLDQLTGELLPVKDQWASTAQLSFQDGPTLYIAGGYGEDHRGDWVTYPQISTVDLPRLIEGVMRGRIPPESIAFTRSPLVQSSGGELVKLPDGYFYLEGHSFHGSYTAFQGQREQNGKAASQVYLDDIRKNENREFAGTWLSGNTGGNVPGRRAVPSTRSQRDPGSCREGSAWRLTEECSHRRQLAFSKPVYSFPDSKPLIGEKFDQKMNAYACATMLIYDSNRETMYTTFFGGISGNSWDAATRSFVENPRIGAKTDPTYLDGLQWSDQVSTIRAGELETSEIVQTQPLPGFIGTDAVFIPLPISVPIRPAKF